MSDITRYESRRAMLTCTGEKFYRFITDLRNFGQFIPAELVKEWTADQSSCRFTLNGLGDMKLNIDHKEPFSLVRFNGNALNTVDFILSAHSSSNNGNMAEVILIMEARLNPIMKMVATGPIENFLESLVREMEKFDNWDQAA